MKQQSEIVEFHGIKITKLSAHYEGQQRKLERESVAALCGALLSIFCSRCSLFHGDTPFRSLRRFDRPSPEMNKSMFKENLIFRFTSLSNF